MGNDAAAGLELFRVDVGPGFDNLARHVCAEDGGVAQREDGRVLHFEVDGVDGYVYHL